MTTKFLFSRTSGTGQNSGSFYVYIYIIRILAHFIYLYIGCSIWLLDQTEQIRLVWLKGTEIDYYDGGTRLALPKIQNMKKKKM